MVVAWSEFFPNWILILSLLLMISMVVIIIFGINFALIRFFGCGYIVILFSASHRYFIKILKVLLYDQIINTTICLWGFSHFVW